MKNLSKLATSSPNSLLKDITFWKNQKIFIVILLVSAVVISILFPWTYPRSDNFVAYLSVFIHFLAFWGIGVAAKIIAKNQVEHAISMSVDEKAADELRKIKSGTKNRINLDRIEDEFLPNNPSPNINMIRLFQQILKEAKDRKFDSSVNIMQPYREESIGDILKLQTIQKVALQLGILGTFIGLILALTQLSLGDNNLIEVTDLNSLFDSLHISFSTSVAGLEVSVILGFLIMLIRRKQEAYFQNMESATVTMISLARNAINKDDFFAEFTQIRHAVNQLSDKVYDQTQEVKVQTQRLDTQTDEIQMGMEKLAEARSDFEEFLNQISKVQKEFLSKINQEQEEFIGEIENLYKILSPEKISMELEQGLTNVVEGLANTFNTNLTESLGKLEELNTSISLLDESLAKVESQLKEQAKWIEESNERLYQTKSELYSSLKEMNDSHTQFANEIRVSTASTNKVLQKSISEAGNNIGQELKYNLQTISQRVVALNRELERYNSLIESQKPLHRKFIEKLREFFSKFSKLFRR